MAETEETENTLRAELATLQARMAALETVGDVGLMDSWVEGIAPDLVEGGEAFPWGKVDLGFSISGTVWTARAGRFYPGARGKKTIAEVTLDFAALGLSDGDYYIFVEATGVASAAWASPPTTDEPLTDGGTYREWFFIATWVASPASLTRKPTGIGFLNIQLPGTHG